ncbi:hypothetical protein [Corynebacterium sp. Marseille-P4321]|uniref:hypothetical protein n=1 Tax=Corynebacterium sp. Marseille-P4321 TaxID=2736603 RepID=UPI0015891B9E|nr:hypothetical protein [Corynebacterium sp. Marseille-P4321]
MEERYERVARLFADLAAVQNDAYLAGYLTTISEQIADAREIPSGLDALFLGDNQGAQRKIFWAPIRGGGDETMRERARDFAIRATAEPLVVLEGLPDLEKLETISSLISRQLELDKKVIVTGDDSAFHSGLKHQLSTQINRLKPELANSADKIKELENRRLQLQHEISVVNSQSLDIVGYKVPLEEAARRISENQAKFEWIQQAGLKRLSARFPLTKAEVENLGRLLESFGSPELHSAEKFVSFEPSLLPTVAEFASLFESSVSGDAKQSTIVTSLLNQWGCLSPSGRASVQRAVNRFLEVTGELEAYGGHLGDEIQREGLSSVYRQISSKEREVRDLYTQFRRLPEALGGNFRIEVIGSPGQYEGAANELLSYLHAGNTLRLKSDGSVRIPYLGHRAVRNAKAFLSGVLIDGKPPMDVASVDLFLSYLHLLRVRELARAIGLQVGTGSFEPPKLLQTTSEAFHDWFQSKSLLGEAVSEIASLEDLGLQTSLIAGREAKTLFSLQNVLDEFIREEAHRADELERLKRLVSDRFPTAAKPDWVRNFKKSLSEGDVNLYRSVLEEISEHNARVEDWRELERLLNKVGDWALPVANSLRRGDKRFQLSELKEAERARRWLQASESSCEYGKQIAVRHQELKKVEVQLDDFQRQTTLLSNLTSGLGEEDSSPCAAKGVVLSNLRFIERSALLRSVPPLPECVNLLVVDDPSALGPEWLCLNYVAKQVVVVSDNSAKPHMATRMVDGDPLAAMARSLKLKDAENLYWLWVNQVPSAHISWIDPSLTGARSRPSKESRRKGEQQYRETLARAEKARRQQFRNSANNQSRASVKRHQGREDYLRLEKYEQFSGSTVSIYVATNDQIDQGILNILAVEGPILERPLFQRYVRRGGDLRVADQATNRLRASILRLKRRGLILEESGERAYRLPDQPAVRPRTKGPRSVDDIPYKEWEAHLQYVVDRHHIKSAEDAYRRALDRVGLERLTVRAESRIARAYRSIR